MSRVLITGANGWIARALGQALVRRGDSVCGLTRRAGSTPDGVAEWLHEADDFEGLEKVWPNERSFDVVVHLAARVHAPKNDGEATEAAYLATNTTATLRLAELSRARGVGRFVFLSSVKALGDTEPGRPWREDDLPRPADAYGRSKRRAEEGLAALEGIEVVTLRPPLVYGPGVRANFARLLRVLQAGWPLPLGGARARRSLVFIDNLVDALALCVQHPEAAGELFHVADGEDLSVRELVTRLGVLLARPARLIPVPVGWLRWVGGLVGRGAEIGRLTQPLRLDTQKIQKLLGWRPPFATQQGLERTVSWYRTTC
jgi:UDP-glucose 4-epimerase